MAQVAAGLGRAEYQGELLPGGDALRRAGITPLVLSGKDGLALISANGVSVGHAALVITRAERVADAADIAAALSMEATAANPSILHPAVARAKPIRGQAVATEHLRALLEGSELLQPGAARSVQDALSFRVVPQVHGALREYATAARAAVTAELNAAEDNPLASVPDQMLISNGPSLRSGPTSLKDAPLPSCLGRDPRTPSGPTYSGGTYVLCRDPRTLSEPTCA
jgi:histidine ammonia-lyase